MQMNSWERNTLLNSVFCVEKLCIFSKTCSRKAVFCMFFFANFQRLGPLLKLGAFKCSHISLIWWSLRQLLRPLCQYHIEAQREEKGWKLWSQRNSSNICANILLKAQTLCANNLFHYEIWVLALLTFPFTLFIWSDFKLTSSNSCLWWYCIRIRTRRGIYGKILPFAWRSSREQSLRELLKAKGYVWPYIPSRVLIRTLYNFNNQ